jgi:hypothetical protein
MGIRMVLSGVSALLLASSTALTTLGAPVIRTASGPNAAAIQAAVDQFRVDLGGSNNGVGGSFTTGRREINWDGVPDNFASPNNLPVDFFNVNSPRGVVFSTAIIADIRVSANSTNPTNTPIRFGEIDPSYPNTFLQVFSAQRLFAVLHPTASGLNDAPVLDVFFFIPGTQTAATVSGFGLVFSDADRVGKSGIICYGIDGKPLGDPVDAPTWDGGLSFVGVSFNAGERIARVKIGAGSKILAPTNTEPEQSDVVAMDDFIYGEPRSLDYHTADFDGDGTSDYSVYRPSTGQWFIINSGSNTFSASFFGTAGDVPIDADFDGDRLADLAVFRPSSGIWYRLDSSNGAFSATSFGLEGDKPVAGDYDKDGKTDIAVWRPGDGNYYILRSSDGGFTGYHFGSEGDIPIGSAPAP